MVPFLSIPENTGASQKFLWKCITSCYRFIFSTNLRVIGIITSQIFVGIPKLEQRKEILSVLTEGINLAEDVQLNKLAEATPGYTGADLASIVQQAVLDAYIRDKV